MRFLSSLLVTPDKGNRIDLDNFLSLNHGRSGNDKNQFGSNFLFNDLRGQSKGANRNQFNSFSTNSTANSNLFDNRTKKIESENFFTKSENKSNFKVYGSNSSNKLMREINNLR